MISLRFVLPALLLIPTPPRQQDATPTLHVNTNLTIVDVTVTDKAGHPVHGLTQSDFVIKEDGKTQPIRNFDEYGTAIPSAQPALPPLPPGIYTNQPKPTPTTSATNIILLDNVETGLIPIQHPELMIYSKLQATNYLKNMPQGTRVAVMISEERLRLVQDVTTDRDILLAAVARVQYKEVQGTTFVPTGRPPMIEEVCAKWNEQSRLTLNTLNQVAAFASGIPGRKNLIWLMPGIPTLTNYERFRKIPCIGNYTPQLQQTYGMLTAAHVALYPIDTHGLQTSVDSSFLSRGDLHDSMLTFAEATGGKAYFNRNDLDVAIADAINTGSDYYSISYMPPFSKFDGQFHTINISVTRSDLKLQYQNGYTSLDLAKLNNSIAQPNPSTTDLPASISQFRSGMAHGAIPSTQLLLATRISPTVTPTQAAAAPIKGDLNPAIKTNPLIRYNIAYSIPAGQLTVANNSASVELDVVAYAEDGTKLNVIRQTANIHLKPEDVSRFQQNPFEVPLQLDLPPGKLFLRVGALDLPSGKYGTLEVPQTVAKPTKEKP